MDDKDNGRKMGEGAQGWNGAESGDGKNNDINGGIISGNGAERHENGPEGASNAKMDIDSLAGEKARGEALEGPRTENEKNAQYSGDMNGKSAVRGENSRYSGNMNGWDKNVLAKKKGVPLWVVLVGILVIIGVVAGVVALVSSRENQGSAEKLPGTSEEKPTEDEEPEPEKPDGTEKVEVLSVDNQVVQRLWHNFDIIADAWSKTEHFYVDKDVARGEVDDMLMTAVAISNLSSVDCKGKYPYGEEYGPTTVGMEAEGCYNIDAVEQKIREIFGKIVDLREKEGILAYNKCHGWTISAENDEIYDSIGPGCGGSGIPVITREIYKAEKQGDDTIYIYERAFMESPGGIYHLGTEPNYMEVPGQGPTLPFDSLGVGEMIAERKWDENGNLVQDVKPGDYVDQFDRFKWIFTKNDDGEYIFTGLERL